MESQFKKKPVLPLLIVTIAFVLIYLFYYKLINAINPIFAGTIFSGSGAVYKSFLVQLLFALFPVGFGILASRQLDVNYVGGELAAKPDKFRPHLFGIGVAVVFGYTLLAFFDLIPQLLPNFGGEYFRSIARIVGPVVRLSVGVIIVLAYRHQLSERSTKKLLIDVGITASVLTILLQATQYWYAYPQHLIRFFSDPQSLYPYTATALVITRNFFGYLVGLGVLAIVGATIGDYLFILFSGIGFGRFKPFVLIHRHTAKISNDRNRFIARVVLHTLSAFVLASLYIIALILIAIAIVFAIVGYILDSDKTTTRTRTIRLPRGARIRKDGEIVQEGIIFDKPTGQKINKQGQVVNKGVIFDQPTGMKIGTDGRVVKEGLLIDTPTGVAIKGDSLTGEQKIVKEGILFDADTGVRIGSDGRVRESGIFIDKEVDVEISADGKVEKK